MARHGRQMNAATYVLKKRACLLVYILVTVKFECFLRWFDSNWSTTKTLVGTAASFSRTHVAYTRKRARLFTGRWLIAAPAAFWIDTLAVFWHILQIIQRCRYLQPVWKPAVLAILQARMHVQDYALWIAWKTPAVTLTRLASARVFYRHGLTEPTWL